MADMLPILSDDITLRQAATKHNVLTILSDYVLTASHWVMTCLAQQGKLIPDCSTRIKCTRLKLILHHNCRHSSHSYIQHLVLHQVKGMSFWTWFTKGYS